VKDSALLRTGALPLRPPSTGFSSSRQHYSWFQIVIIANAIIAETFNH
jgi:hypothetical protein